MYIRDLHQHQWRLPGFPQNGILLDVGVGGNVLVLPTSTLYIYVGVGRKRTGFTYTYIAT